MSLLTDTDIKGNKGKGVEGILSPSSFPDSGFTIPSPTGSWIHSREKLLIFPFYERLLTPVGYDLTIGDVYLSFAQRRRVELAGPDESFLVQPRETIIIRTQEYVGLPKNQKIAGIIESSVSMMSAGFSPVSTTLDPDWEGRLQIAITNQQSFPLELNKGQRICTAMFLTCEHEATKLSGFQPDRPDTELRLREVWLVEKEREVQALRQVEETQQAAEAREMERAKKREAAKKALLQIIVIVVFLGLGNCLFGPVGGFEAMAAAGVAIALAIPPLYDLIFRR